MKLEKTDKPVWHGLNRLDSIRQFVMCEDSRHVLDNWSIKYINIRIDMRTGNFALTEGNTKTPSYLKIV
jgi:hypothetical protein